MSSATVSYGWSYAPPEETYRNNVAYLENLFGGVIEEIKQKAKVLSAKGIPAESLVSHIEDLAEEIVSEYSINILMSPYHRDWVDNKVSNFNSLALKIKGIIATLEVELDSKGEEDNAEFYLRLYSSIPAEFRELRDFFKPKAKEAIKERIRKILEKAQSVRELLTDHKDTAEAIISAINEEFAKLEDPDMIEELKKLEAITEKYLSALRRIEYKDEIDFYDELLKITPTKFKSAGEFLKKKLQEAVEIHAHELENKVKELEKRMEKCGDVMRSITGAISHELRACANINSIEEFRNLETEVENFLKNAGSIDTAKESDEIIKELYSITPMRFKEAREGIGKEIIKREVLKEINARTGYTQADEEAVDLEVLRRDFSLFANKIKALDDNMGSKVSELEREVAECEDAYRAKLLLEEVKKTYIEVRDRTALTRVLKEDIEELKKHIKSEELLREAEELLEKKYIERSEFFAFRKKVWNEGIRESRKQEVRAEEVLSKLRELGYTIIDEEEELRKTLEKGETVELRTPYGEDYILKVKVQDGKITTKLVKILEEERELSTYEREKDVYTAQKWCKDFDMLLEKLKEEGINVEVKARVGPEEKGIDYEVREKKRRKSAREEKHGRPDQKRRSV